MFKARGKFRPKKEGGGTTRSIHQTTSHPNAKEMQKGGPHLHSYSENKTVGYRLSHPNKQRSQDSGEHNSANLKEKKVSPPRKIKEVSQISGKKRGVKDHGTELKNP